MTFTHDHYTQIGKTHLDQGTVCQDYATSDLTEFGAYSIVCDGCSSGGRTDVGARMLALWTARTLSEGVIDASGMKMHQHALFYGSLVSRFGLRTEDMLSTCATVCLNPNGGFVCIQGDGIAAFKYKSGLIAMHEFSWAKNAPIYPAYTDEDLYVYMQMLHKGDESKSILHHTLKNLYPPGADVNEDTGESILTFEQGKAGIVIDIKADWLNDLDCVAVFSDGVMQLQDRADEWPLIVRECLGFKNDLGRFLERRMKRELKDLAKLGVQPLDDISCAVVKVIHDAE